MRGFQEQLTAGPWLVKVFTRLGAALLVLLLVLTLLPGTRPLVPIVLSLGIPLPAEPAQGGHPALSDVPGDLVMVVSHRAIAESTRGDRFESTLWSYAWLNLLEQEFGAPAVVDLDDLRAGSLEGRRVALFTRSAAQGEAPPRAREEAERFVREGGCLVLEMPGASWEGLSGVLLSEEPVNPSARVWRGAPLAWEDVPPGLDGTPGSTHETALLLDMPVSTWLKRVLMLDAEAVPLGRISDQPAFVLARHGGGRVLSLCFDLGYQLQTLQQGVPAGPGWHVPEQEGLVPGLVETQDLVAASPMRDASTPFADLLEGWFAGLLSDLAGPLPGWWRFPYAYDGLLALSHDEEGRGLEGSRAALALDRDLGVRPTVFVLPGEDLARRWPSENEDLELHWNRFLSPPQGLPPFHLVPLARQVEEVARVRGSRPRLSRIHYLAWGPEYAEPFRRLAAAGIELDSSYGPNRGKGYLFGTGLPFRVLDRNGLPLPVKEWPFLAQEDWFGADADWLEGLLARSGAVDHEAPVLLYHPHRTMITDPGREALRRVVAAARLHRHQVAPMSEYRDFRAAREKAVLRSSYREGNLRVDLDCPEAGMAVRVPAEEGAALLLDGVPAQNRRVRLGDRWFALVEVPEGRHLLEAGPRP